MADVFLGLLSLSSALGFGWLVHQAFKRGESVTPYGIDSTRSGNPVLFWFDTGIMIFFALGSVAAGMGLIF